MKDLLHYSVGPLLYCPANKTTLSDSIISGKFGSHFSLAMCLEDTIKDSEVDKAEIQLINSLLKIYHEGQNNNFYIPKIFIRVRSPKQINSLYDRSGEAQKLLTGFIIPKFSLENADSYINEILRINSKSNVPIYMMPIFESPTIINLKNRADILYTLKEKLDAVEKLVLNIRVGGNDLCHMFGFRRHKNETIHQIRPVADIFSDIITAYGMSYVVSGPVWEYYNGDGWESGLINELEQDRLCGFIGKTIIHPNQIPIVNSAYAVSKSDLADADSILNWNETALSLVSGNPSGERMNEYKTHYNWAKKIKILSNAYGIKPE